MGVSSLASLTKKMLVFGLLFCVLLNLSSSKLLDSTSTPPSVDSCELEALAPCAHSAYPDSDFGCCKSPYTCTLTTSVVSQCTGSNLPAGSTCFNSVYGGVSSTCADGLICVDGICKVDDPTCSEHGVPGHNICYDGSKVDVFTECCPTSDGIPAYCVPILEKDSQNSACMKYTLPVGSICGTTKESNYAGYCDTGLICVDGVCEVETTCVAAGAACSTGQHHTCCDPSDEISAYCMPTTDSQNPVCMQYPLPVGSMCGTTKESNYAGYCDQSIGLICVDGVCQFEKTCVAAGATCSTGQTCCDSRTCTAFGPTSYCI